MVLQHTLSAMRWVWAAALCLVAAPALADRIDGQWCNGSGEHIIIDGPAITLSTGGDLIGDYNRHAFRYDAPDGDPDAGMPIDLMLDSDEQMTLSRPGSTEIWHRCRLTS